MSMNSTPFAFLRLQHPSKLFIPSSPTQALPRLGHFNISLEITGLIPTEVTAMLSSWSRRRVDRRDILSCIPDERPPPSRIIVNEGSHRSPTVSSKRLIIFPSTEPFTDGSHLWIHVRDQSLQILRYWMTIPPIRICQTFRPWTPPNEGAL